MNKNLVNKYKKELTAYTFPESKYYMLMNEKSKKNEVLNEVFNRNVFANTPSDYYMNNGKIIYYNSLKGVNNNIIEWIEIFSMKASLTDNERNIYSLYVETLNKIIDEIKTYARLCTLKYNLKFAIDDTINCTLVKTYIGILWERKLKINNKLRIIIENESSLCYTDYIDELLKIRDIYSTKLLCMEDECEEIYDEFRNIVREILNVKKIVKKKGNT